MNKSDLKTGMIVTLRRGVERVIIGKYLFDEQGDTTGTINNYYDDLIYMNNCKSEDIMKIEYGGEIIWERVEWDKVPFGTKVRVWEEDEETELVGRLLYYYGDNRHTPFYVFIESEKNARWFWYCEIIKEDE